MKKLSIIVFIFPILFLACQEENLPVSTKSDVALQNYLKARELFEKVNYQDAVPFLEAALEADSNFALAYLFLAQTRPSVNDRYSLIEKAKSLSNNVSKGERLIILGYEAGAFGYSKKQEKYFQELVEAYPKDEQALLHLANFYFGQREYDKSLVYYKRIIEINPNFSIPYNQMGYVYRYKQDYPAAEESFKKYIKLSSTQVLHGRWEIG